jgi:hypothetical protein
MLAKPPTMKNNGMTCTSQLTGANHAWFSRAFVSSTPPAPTLTPTISECSATTTARRIERTASMLPSLAGRASARPAGCVQTG